MTDESMFLLQSLYEGRPLGTPAGDVAVFYNGVFVEVSADCLDECHSKEWIESNDSTLSLTDLGQAELLIEQVSRGRIEPETGRKRKR